MFHAHGGFGHIIWNMLGLWMFGADLERLMGERGHLELLFLLRNRRRRVVVLFTFWLPTPWATPLRDDRFVGSHFAVSSRPMPSDFPTGLFSGIS